MALSGLTYEAVALERLGDIAAKRPFQSGAQTLGASSVAGGFERGRAFPRRVQ